MPRWPRLAGVAGSGVRMRAGTERLAPDAPDPWWRDAVPGLRAHARGPALRGARRRHVGPPAVAGRPPARARRQRSSAITSLSLDELDADAVVNCAGLGARELAADASLIAVRGQVVRVSGARACASGCSTSPTPSGSSTSSRASTTSCSAAPREEGAEDRTPDPATTAAIRARCAALVPALRDAPVVERRRRAAARAPDGAPGGRGPRRALLRPRRRRRDPRLGLRRGGSRTSRRRRRALRCAAVK